MPAGYGERWMNPWSSLASHSRQIYKLWVQWKTLLQKNKEHKHTHALCTCTCMTCVHTRMCIYTCNTHTHTHTERLDSNKIHCQSHAPVTTWSFKVPGNTPPQGHLHTWSSHLLLSATQLTKPQQVSLLTYLRDIFWWQRVSKESSLVSVLHSNIPVIKAKSHHLLFAYVMLGMYLKLLP